MSSENLQKSSKSRMECSGRLLGVGLAMEWIVAVFCKCDIGVIGVILV